MVRVCLGARREGKGGSRDRRPSAQGHREPWPGRRVGGDRKLDNLASVPAASGREGSGRGGTGWDWPVRELGAPGGHP